MPSKGRRYALYIVGIPLHIYTRILYIKSAASREFSATTATAAVDADTMKYCAKYDHYTNDHSGILVMDFFFYNDILYITTLFVLKIMIHKHKCDAV